MRGVNLTETNLHNVLLRDSGVIEVSYFVKDEDGNLVAANSDVRDFVDWGNQIRAAANALMRLLDQEIKGIAVNENKSTWVDK